MEELFNLFQGTEIIHDNYKGIVCGYNQVNFLLAVETKDINFFRKLDYDFILPEFKDNKYRYVYENESEILKQKR